MEEALSFTTCLRLCLGPGSGVGNLDHGEVIILTISRFPFPVEKTEAW